jgi:hypothetical protein
MDHLIIPDGTAHIRVPYKATELFDGEDFLSYPERMGWSREHLFGHANFGGRTDAEVEGFFQTWLYFGTLITIFALHDVEIDTSEFWDIDESNGHMFVTTADVLPSKIRAWRDRRSASDDPPDYREESKEILEELSTFIDRFIGVEGREADGIMRAPGRDNKWPVAHEISMSMIALGYILGNALREIYNDGEILMHWGASPRLKATLLENGWCPLDVRRLLTDVGIDGHYYLSLKEFAYDKTRHHHCDETICRASTVDEATYVTKHVPNEYPECKHQPVPEDVVRVVQNEGIPVVSWRKNTEGVSSGFTVEDAGKGGVPFVAISHV